MSRGLLTTLLLLTAGLCAQTPRVLYVTHSAGYRHESIEASTQVLRSLSPRVEVTATEDLSVISDEGLRPYSAVFFFTSGELPITPAQKNALLTYLRNGGGFGGVHSATDTLYTWPEYGELIGGYFEGHPWTEKVRIDVEDPDHPATRHLGAGWTLTDEIYQFRDLRRDRVRVLMTLDMRSVDPAAPGAHRHTTDFPLAWVREYGGGRIFYTALGHFESTWRDRRFQQMLEGALLWLTRQVDGVATLRRSTTPRIAGISSGRPNVSSNTVFRESWASIYGTDLTSGSTMIGDDQSFTLAGTSVTVDGQPARLGYASPSQLNIFVPSQAGLQARSVEVSVRGVDSPASAAVAVEQAALTCSAISQHGLYMSVWATGLSTGVIEARVNGQQAAVLFAGPSPEWPGVHQINIALRPEWAGSSRQVEVLNGGRVFCERALLINNVNQASSGINAY